MIRSERLPNNGASLFRCKGSDCDAGFFRLRPQQAYGVLHLLIKFHQSRGTNSGLG